MHENKLPDSFGWVEIPGGRVTLSRGWDSEAYGVGKTFDVPAFAIARYPITNAQFAVFMTAGGYETRRWWTDSGWEARNTGWKPVRNLDGEWTLVATGVAWSEPRYWRQSKWNGDQQPVVGVSWHESLAFCTWLSEVSEAKISLPTEQQWQRAAQGDDGRRFPWGNDWDCTRCNNSISPCESNQTTDVTHYEGRGDSPYGVVDMSGNVWEWSLTDYDNGHQDPMSLGRRVLRGGSWFYVADADVRADFRNSAEPVTWDDVFGFRPVLAR